MLSKLRAPVADEKPSPCVVLRREGDLYVSIDLETDGEFIYGIARGTKVETGTWNIRESIQPPAPLAAALASAPVAGEVVGKVVLFGGDVKEVSWTGGKMPPPGTTLYAAPQASEAVQLLRQVREQDFLSDTMRHRIDRLLDSAALSAQPAAEPLSNPKQFPLTGAENVRDGAPYDDPAFETLCREHGIWGTAEAALCAVFWQQAGQQRAAGDERAAFETTYQADYDDPGAACEREHFGKGYRAGMAAQSGEWKKDIPENLFERLRHHAADKSNTAFARSTMSELAGYLSPTHQTDGADRE